jgi:galactosylceramidase
VRRAVAVIGEHYPEYRSPAAAHTLGKPVWSSEDGPWRGDWEGAAKLARMFNRNYAIGRMTKTIIWSPVTSYYDTLPLPGSGLMRANEPWTGHYAVQPAIWIVAHTTQFAQPGWQYLDGACREIPGGSIVALRSPNRRDFSVIIETMDATNRQTLRLAVEGFPPARPVYLWRSDARAQFEALGEIKPDGGGFTLALEPNTAYSLTTTRGQQRGEYGRVPASQPFPLPHRDHFERYAAGAMPRYFSDQAGVWEVVRRADGRGKALRQVLPQKGIEWHFHKDPTPQTFLGDPSWRDYEVRADVRLEAAGFACLYGRVSLIPQRPEPPGGYCLKVQHDGRWELLAPIQKRGDKPGENKSANLDGPPLAQGRVPFNLNAWHALQLRMAGPEISVVIDGQQVAVVQDATHAAGQAGVGSGWQAVEFDNFQALPVSAKP